MRNSKMKRGLRNKSEGKGRRKGKDNDSNKKNYPRKETKLNKQEKRRVMVGSQQDEDKQFHILQSTRHAWDS